MIQRGIHRQVFQFGEGEVQGSARQLTQVQTAGADLQAALAVGAEQGLVDEQNITRLQAE